MAVTHHLRRNCNLSHHIHKIIIDVILLKHNFCHSSHIASHRLIKRDVFVTVTQLLVWVKMSDVINDEWTDSRLPNSDEFQVFLAKYLICSTVSWNQSVHVHVCWSIYSSLFVCRQFAFLIVKTIFVASDVSTFIIEVCLLL